MVSNPNKTLGRAEIKVDGKLLEIEDPSFSPSGIERPSVADGKAFYETEMGGKVEGSINYKAGTSLTEINKMDDVTLIFAGDTGQTYVAAHAWCESVKDLKTKGEGFSVTFAFAKSEEMVNG